MTQDIVWGHTRLLSEKYQMFTPTAWQNTTFNQSMRITSYLSRIGKLSPGYSFGDHLQITVLVDVTWTKNNVIKRIMMIVN